MPLRVPACATGHDTAKTDVEVIVVAVAAVCLVLSVGTRHFLLSAPFSTRQSRVSTYGNEAHGKAVRSDRSAFPPCDP